MCPQSMPSSSAARGSACGRVGTAGSSQACSSAVEAEQSLRRSASTSAGVRRSGDDGLKVNAGDLDVRPRAGSGPARAPGRSPTARAAQDRCRAAGRQARCAARSAARVSSSSVTSLISVPFRNGRSASRPTAPAGYRFREYFRSKSAAAKSCRRPCFAAGRRRPALHCGVQNIDTDSTIARRETSRYARLEQSRAGLRRLLTHGDVNLDFGTLHLVGARPSSPTSRCLPRNRLGDRSSTKLRARPRSPRSSTSVIGFDSRRRAGFMARPPAPAPIAPMSPRSRVGLSRGGTGFSSPACRRLLSGADPVALGWRTVGPRHFPADRRGRVHLPTAARRATWRSIHARFRAGRYPRAQATARPVRATCGVDASGTPRSLTSKTRGLRQHRQTASAAGSANNFSASRAARRRRRRLSTSPAPARSRPTLQYQRARQPARADQGSTACSGSARSRPRWAGYDNVETRFGDSLPASRTEGQLRHVVRAADDPRPSWSSRPASISTKFDLDALRPEPRTTGARPPTLLSSASPLARRRGQDGIGRRRCRAGSRHIRFAARVFLGDVSNRRPRVADNPGDNRRVRAAVACNSRGAGDAALRYVGLVAGGRGGPWVPAFCRGRSKADFPLGIGMKLGCHTPWW